MTTTYNKQVLLRRGNTAVSSAYIGPVGEVTVDTDLDSIRVHDGVTPGGRLATSSYSGTTPPGAPRENMLWYDTDGGRLYVYYSGAWVDASPAGDQELNANVAQLSQDVAIVELHITSLDANIGAFETAVSDTYNNFNDLISANVGTFETTVTSTVNTINSNINTLNATIAGFEAQPGPTSDAWVDDAPPDISNVGALWYDADSGRLYVYYSGAWVDASPPSTTGFAVSGFVNAGTFVTMDLIKATVTTSGQRGLSLATTTGTFSYNIGGTFGMSGAGSGGSLSGQTLTTSATTSIFGWGFAGAGDVATYILNDTTNNRAYRITVQIATSYNNNMISIERLI